MPYPNAIVKSNVVRLQKTRMVPKTCRDARKKIIKCIMPCKFDSPHHCINSSVRTHNSAIDSQFVLKNFNQLAIAGKFS